MKRFSLLFSKELQGGNKPSAFNKPDYRGTEGFLQAMLFLKDLVLVANFPRDMLGLGTGLSNYAWWKKHPDFITALDRGERMTVYIKRSAEITPGGGIDSIKIEVQLFHKREKNPFFRVVRSFLAPDGTEVSR
jgi:hypothetical protein